MTDIVERLRELEAVESELSHECDCPPEATANYRYAMTCAEAADTITALRAENERLKIENIQMQAALGYGILAEDERHILPSNPFKCGTCDASKHLRAEVERLRAAQAFTPTHRHIKRGSVYQVVGRAMLQSGIALSDTHPLVVYRAEDGSLWARPPEEFNDGRFAALEGKP